VNETSRSAAQSVGFIGLGTMGAPIAARLLGAGARLIVWNRTPSRCQPLAQAGAAVAASVDELCARCEVIVLMVTDGPALDAVLDRGGPGFTARVRGRTIVSLSTIPSGHSAGLARDVATAGGRYVEAPISGSRRPAEQGQLVAMLAGNESDVRRVQVLLAPACREMVACGPVPNALLMKHATNLVLIPTMVSLAEAAAFVRQAGLSMEAFASTLLAGQMASDLLRAKLPKLVAQDWAPHSSTANVLLSGEATRATVRETGGEAPLLAEACRLVAAARDRGLGDKDVLAMSAGAPRTD
jgi:3-hydroxyisobutyrate dehydrogenase